ncbi:MAG: hypothetical protein AAGJ28_13650 [Pseudomonadota bacterium]
MADTDPTERPARVDPAGRPLEGRGRQALMALAIMVSWFCLIVLMFWATGGGNEAVSAKFFAATAVLGWLLAEVFGSQRGLVWPTSALALAGSLSLGISVGLATTPIREPNMITSLAILTGVASLSMTTYLFRFRLPGLVSPIITFAIISLFLASYGASGEGLQKVEGLSPRGILAALIGSPLWMSVFGALSLVAVLLARHLDLKGDDFGLASARPLHIVGAGVLALIVGRILAGLPGPLDLFLLLIIWIAGAVWALRINRVAVMLAVHLAISKPLMIALASTFGWAVWRPSLDDWALVLLLIALADLVLWLPLHQISLARGWTLGPGGRIPRRRDGMGWWWRYWPYA